MCVVCSGQCYVIYMLTPKSSSRRVRGVMWHGCGCACACVLAVQACVHTCLCGCVTVCGERKGCMRARVRARAGVHAHGACARICVYGCAGVRVCARAMVRACMYVSELADTGSAGAIVQVDVADVVPHVSNINLQHLGTLSNIIAAVHMY
jgi:hypothetical protein